MGNNRKRTCVSREQLYEEIWAEPISTVSQRYQVSGSFLARICTRLNVPRPPRGYWAMVAAGRNMKKVPLPEARPGDELEWARSGYSAVAQMPRPAVPEANAQGRRRSILPKRHLLLTDIEQTMLEGKESSCGFLSPKRGHLADITCSKESLGRSLDVANHLFLAFEKRGHSVILEPYGQGLRRYRFDEREKGGRDRPYNDLWNPSRSTLLLIGTVAFGISIFEMTENVEVQYQDGKYTRLSDLPTKNLRRQSYSWVTKHDLPSGRLCVQIYSPYPRVNWVRQWREAKSGHFPRKLSAVVREIEEQAPAIVQLFEAGEREAELERQRAEAERLRREREEAERLRVECEQDSHQNLEQIIQAWARVKQIEHFFSDVERQAIKLSPEQQVMIKERLRLGREALGSTDAIQWFADWRTPEETLQDKQEEQRRWRNSIWGISDDEEPA